ncbi:DUF4148 domain-containing protein [Paraburkholderia tagetis]|uniref:DUF4148 domain-containing protein n=1 Tax=Paraburkholderia tagetis TaxID=2913261 RepID=A0A9X1RQD6_9BURK|nr:DUF4148 domain-containing protein [Paraburkholderia tagetis]MCG5074825.1 DUF4148 domain-containing protein [Paraburkholderia tagetis]
MKSLINIAFAVALVAPSLSHAAVPLTRAQVRAELIDLEDAGYNPIDDDNYPQNLEHAQAIVAQQNKANNAYGSDTAGASQSSGMAQTGEK